MGTGSDERVRFAPNYAFPPGEFLVERLDELGMTQTELSRRTGLSQKHISQLTNGEVALSPATALLLEKVTRMPAHLWNRLEATYRTHRSKEREAQELDSQRVQAWVDEVPHQELAKRGYIDRSNDRASLAGKLLRFFGVGSLEAWDNVFDRIGVAHYRQAEGVNKNAATIAAWLRVCELRATQIACVDFDRDRFLKVVASARHASVKEPKEWWPQLVDAFASAGAALVLEPEFPGKTELNGASWWATPKKAVIALTGRRKKADGIYFTVLHEAAHVVRHSKKQTFIDAKDSVPKIDAELEHEADTFAARHLIAPAEWSRVETIPNDRTAYARVRAIAKELRVHPGILVGQLQARAWRTHDGSPDYGFCNNLKQSVDLSGDFWHYSGGASSA